jgi:hypothetical protein
VFKFTVSQRNFDGDLNVLSLESTLVYEAESSQAMFFMEENTYNGILLQHSSYKHVSRYHTFYPQKACEGVDV